MADGFRTQQRLVDYVGEPNISPFPMLSTKITIGSKILNLTIEARAGVEEQSPVLHPSCHFRWRLLGYILSIQSLKAVAGYSCRASNRSTESDAGHLRGFGGLLYLEAWGEGLRTR